MQPNLDAAKTQFTQVFGPGGDIQFVRAPGRVNLIGEHTDYNDGFVFPMAIEPHVLITFCARADGQVRLATTFDPGTIAELSLKDKITTGTPKWANYSRGMAAMLVAAGIPLVGMDALLTNTLPVGGGLSSSAALEVGTGRALLALAGTDVTGQMLAKLPEFCDCPACRKKAHDGIKLDSLWQHLDADPKSTLALMGQRAEHEFGGTPSGIMDQTIVSAGRAGTAMLMDCRDLSKQFIPIDPAALRVVIANSMVHHELSGGEYAERRSQCEEGAAFFKAKALRDVTMEQVNNAKGKLPEVVFRRCRHVVGEIIRATEAARQLVAKDYHRVGELMQQSHDSLRDDYQVSTAELDYLVIESMKIEGVYGARMTGGGFGGCIVALVKPDRVDALVSHLNAVYPTRVGKKPEIYVTTATDGAKVVSKNQSSSSQRNRGFLPILLPE